VESSKEGGLCRVAVEQLHLPPMAAGATFHWDGMGTVSPSIGPPTGSEPDPSDLPVVHSFTPASRQAECQTAMGRHARPSPTAGKMGLTRLSLPQAITLYVHPVLLVHAADESCLGDHVEIVPHLHAGDPLLHLLLLRRQGLLLLLGVVTSPLVFG
jgi:hypothetical protein